jgi:plasmid stabilization system protein ParE
MYRVVFTPRAQAQLAELCQYIAQVASPNTTAKYTNAIVSSSRVQQLIA